jgi:hypothetical protein
MLQTTDVFVVVQKEEPGDDGDVRYSVEIVCKDGVPRPFRPLLPEPSIFKKSEFRQFFLSKRM